MNPEKGQQIPVQGWFLELELLLLHPRCVGGYLGTTAGFLDFETRFMHCSLWRSKDDAGHQGGIRDASIKSSCR
jgi:hypothetical protein